MEELNGGWPNACEYGMWAVGAMWGTAITLASLGWGAVVFSFAWLHLTDYVCDLGGFE